MLDIQLNNLTSTATLIPHGALTEEDLKLATDTIDSFIAQYGKLRGIIIYSQDFPGWDSFGALIEHLKFIKDHHELVTHIALVTDSTFGDFAELIASHFISAQILSFTYDDLMHAEDWIALDHV